jgi:hypothetical protein
MRTRKPFSLTLFLAVQPVCGVVSFVFAVFLDNALRTIGIDIHPWKEALTAALGGVFFLTTCAPLAWRLGLITLPQYFLAAVWLFMPATIIWLAVGNLFTPIAIDMAQYPADLPDNKVWAISTYIRIVRSAIISPVYILSFWFFYHYLLARDICQFTSRSPG